MDYHDVLFLFHPNVLSPFRTSSYHTDSVFGCSYVFNIFILMCHKFLHLCTHYVIIYAFSCCLSIYWFIVC
jgi:hypothetical protein